MKPNSMRRRVVVAALAAVSAALLLQQGPAAAQNRKPFRVVTTFTVIQDIAQNVAGDRAIVESITKPGAEIHDYQPTPITEGPYSGKPNPHAWMSPNNALIYVENIRKALVQYDPANAEAYNRNAAEYSTRIKALDEPLRKRLAEIPEAQRWLVSSEGAFSYLTRDYKMKEAYLWPINADEQGTPQQVRKVIDIVRKNKIPVVFSESTISDRAAKQVARETGARYGGVLYVDSLSAASGPTPTYLDLLKVTVETIAKGFGK
jgi:manganese/iron transport system substrate-binding protein